ncbi:hypothetical protein [Nocardia asteroides]|uniref:hypothetical protein n=1 Tax=Nocardia asteroides TaxID=1824 RepID=UPI00365B5849
MSLTPERLEQIRAQHAAGLLTNTAADLLIEIDRLTAELADEARATQYYAEQAQRRRAERDRYHNAWHNAADRAQDARDDVKFTEERLRAATAEPLTLRWSVQDIAFVDDGSVELYLTTTAGQPALLPLSAEQAAALRDDLPGNPTRAEVLEEAAAWLAEVGEHDTAHLLRNVEDLFPAPTPDADGGAR